MMKYPALLATLFSVLFLGFSIVSAAETINGAGATFPYPLYSKWAYDYAKQTGIRLNYQSIGSGGGIKQVKAKTVDFGATDAPLSAEELKQAGLIQFPMAIGGVTPVVNLAGVGPAGLSLTDAVLADIYSGAIKKWNDRRIIELNPSLKLPDDTITVVHRSDGSGTTWIFTNYLSKTSKDWEKKTGFGTAVNWPAGVGGKGNEGVASYVKRIKNSIGYVEYAYAIQNKLAFTKLKNRDNALVEPSMESFASAAEGADWAGTPGFSVVLTNQAGKNSWPIAGATFILLRKDADNCATTKTVLDFFDWAYKNGSVAAKALDYVPIPKNVYELMHGAWAGEIKCDGRPVWTR